MHQGRIRREGPLFFVRYCKQCLQYERKDDMAETIDDKLRGIARAGEGGT